MNDVVTATPAGERTKRAILEMGARLWGIDPGMVTARRIAKELGMVHGSVTYHFPAGERPLRDAIAHYAVQSGESRCIAHLIAGNHKAVSMMDDTARMEHMKIAAGR